jgi:hypothetical protein
MTENVRHKNNYFCAKTCAVVESGDHAMHIFGYGAIGFLVVCMLLAGAKALSVDTASTVIAVTDMAQVMAPDVTERQNQTDGALESLQDLAEGEGDLLNILD